MPEPAEFLHGFHLTKGLTINQFTLVEATATHQVVKRYQEYRYQLTLKFQQIKQITEANFFSLYDQLMPIIKQEPIIYGLRNPYRCRIETPQTDDIYLENDHLIVFKLIGHSYRA